MTRWPWFVLVGLAYGVTAGDSASNHDVYLLDGLRWLDPAFLQHDWFATEATHYHRSFTVLVAALATLGVLPWALAAGNVALVATAMWAWRDTLEELDDTHADLLWRVTVAGYVLGLGGVSAGVSYLFSPSLQPSSLGSLGWFLAMRAFVRKEDLTASAWLAFAGLAHTNFLVLAVPWFALAGLREPARLPRLLGPVGVVLAASVPFILSTVGQGLPDAIVASANRIYIDFAVPFHYRPDPADLVPLVATLAAGAVAAVDARSSRLVALWASSAVLVVFGMLFTTGVLVDPVSRLYLYRLAPFVSLLSWALVARALVRRLPVSRFAAPAASVALLAAAASMVSYPRHRMILGDGRQADDHAVYAWVRDNTPPDTVLLTPPYRLEGMRLHGERAIVVGGKALPVRADEILAWHDRLVAVAGFRPKSRSQLNRAYERMDAEHASRVARSYGASFVVTERGSKLDASGWKHAFRAGRWVVLKVPGGR